MYNRIVVVFKWYWWKWRGQFELTLKVKQDLLIWKKKGFCSEKWWNDGTIHWGKQESNRANFEKELSFWDVVHLGIQEMSIRPLGIEFWNSLGWPNMSKCIYMEQLYNFLSLREIICHKIISILSKR